jgi:hypothetical protein
MRRRVTQSTVMLQYLAHLGHPGNITTMPTELRLFAGISSGDGQKASLFWITGNVWPGTFIPLEVTTPSNGQGTVQAGYIYLISSPPLGCRRPIATAVLWVPLQLQVFRLRNLGRSGALGCLWLACFAP